MAQIPLWRVKFAQGFLKWRHGMVVPMPNKSDQETLERITRKATVVMESAMQAEGNVQYDKMQMSVIVDPWSTPSQMSLYQTLSWTILLDYAQPYVTPKMLSAAIAAVESIFDGR